MTRVSRVSRFASLVAERIYNLELREDDIWVVSYPKTCTVLYCTAL